MSSMPKQVEPVAILFQDDGETPNNPVLPLILYRAAVDVSGTDPAAAFERLFAQNGWADGWRNGSFAVRPFHPAGPEGLGIARGTARVEFGGAGGQEIDLAPGDVAIRSAGCGHRRVSGSRDLLVVGAYPRGSSAHHSMSGAADLAAARVAIARTPLPAADPAYGKDGPLIGLWQMKTCTT